MLGVRRARYEWLTGVIVTPRKAAADLGVKLPDCCVLLAAQEHAGAVASFDAGVIKAACKLGLRTVE